MSFIVYLYIIKYEIPVKQFPRNITANNMCCNRNIIGDIHCIRYSWLSQREMIFFTERMPECPETKWVRDTCCSLISFPFVRLICVARARRRIVPRCAWHIAHCFYTFRRFRLDTYFRKKHAHREKKREILVVVHGHVASTMYFLSVIRFISSEGALKECIL